MADFFDDVEQQTVARPKDPIWKIDLDDQGNDKEILKWLIGEKNYLQEINRDRFEKIKKDIALYKGMQYQDQNTRETRTELRDRLDQRNRNYTKLVINEAFDLVKINVSRIIKYKPGFSILPTNDEFSDKIAAKMVKSLVDHIWYVEDFEGQIAPEWIRLSKLCGEGYLFPVWDKDKGDLHPDYKKLKAQNKRIPMIGDDGKQAVDPKTGKPLWIDRPVKTGDVAYDLVMPMDVLVHQHPTEKSFRRSQYCFRKYIYHVDEAKQLWPDKAGEIQAQRDVQMYNYETHEVYTVQNHVEVWQFSHRRDRFMDKGRQIHFTQDVILDNGPFPFSHDKLPFICLPDIKVPGELHSMSFIRMVRGMIGGFNNMTNMILRNLVMVGHPKWMMPAGAAKIESLGNDITIVQYKGPVAPQLVAMPTTPKEIFDFRQILKEEIQQKSGAYGVSRGEPPPGVKAGVALQFLNEQEQERANEDILNWNEAVKELVEMTISICGDKYDPTDKRFIRVIGKGSEWQKVFFDSTQLSKDYDVRVQNASALPQSKAARVQTLIDLTSAFPGLVSPEQVLDLLDLAQSEKFIDINAVSIRSAEAENELILQGKPVGEPKEYEKHIHHWKIHVRQLQEFSFKNITPEPIQENLKDHILATEMLMYNLSLKNLKFAEELKTLDQWPVFFRVPLPPQASEPAPVAEPQLEAMSQGIPVENQMPFEGIEQQQPIAEPMPELMEQLGNEVANPNVPANLGGGNGVV